MTDKAIEDAEKEVKAEKDEEDAKKGVKKADEKKKAEEPEERSAPEKAPVPNKDETKEEKPKGKPAGTWKNEDLGTAQDREEAADAADMKERKRKEDQLEADKKTIDGELSKEKATGESDKAIEKMTKAADKAKGVKEPEIPGQDAASLAQPASDDDESIEAMAKRVNFVQVGAVGHG